MATQTVGAGRPLDVVAEIASRLNAHDDIVVKTNFALDRLVVGFDATECSLWLETPQGLVCVARAGAALTPPHELAPLFELDDATTGNVAVRSVFTDGRRIGALVLRVEAGFTQDQILGFEAATSILGTQLARVEETRVHAAAVAEQNKTIVTQRAFTDHVIDALPVGLYVIDREYRVQMWNRKRESGTQGVSREAALGKTIFEILHRAPAERLKKEFDEVFKTDRVQQFNMETKISGESKTYRLTKIPLHVDGDERVTHVITLGEDVTEWASTYDRFALTDKLASLGQLAGGVMQELDTPLDTVNACASRLSTRLQSLPQIHAEAKPALDLIAHEVARCKGIVRNLLDFSKPGATDKRPTSLNRAVEQAAALLKHHQRFRTVRVKLALDPALPTMVAAHDQMVQVFIALLHNAADAMDGAGTVTVCTRRVDHELVAEVIDEGVGIGRSDLLRIFEPFYTTKAPGRGNGLGLSICHAIVTDHGGRVEVDSAVGAGSTFRLIFKEN